MSLVKVAELDDLTSGKMTAVKVNGKKILLANVDGKFYAMQDKCNHLGASLSQGCLSGIGVKCPKHNVIFDFRTGYPTCKGKMLFFDVKAKDQDTYHVLSDGKSLFIDAD